MDRDELDSYVEQSQSLIDASPQMDEQNTRRKLIEPLLELLGWNMLSPEVELEYSVQMGAGTKKVDYALMIGDTPVIFVEAKGLDSAITDSHRNQLTSYMRQTGVDWGLLTNGENFEILKRKTDGKRPNEILLGTFSLEELPDNIHLLRALSRDLIKTGEAESIAENVETTRRAATKLRENKEALATQISQVVTEEIGESVSQTVQDGAKQFVDVLASSLENHGQGQDTLDLEKQTKIVDNGGTAWTPQEGASAIAGTKARAEISGDDEDSVAIFPTKQSGVDFLKENNAWGFVRVGREPEFVAMYVSEDVQQIKYVATIKEIIPAAQAELARPPESYSEAASADAQAGFDPDKNVILFEPDSLFELSDPIPFETEWPQSLRYTTLGELKQANSTDDIL